MAFSNESLMWIGIAVWVVFVLMLGYFAFFGGTTKNALPSGNSADLGNLASTS